MSQIPDSSNRTDASFLTTAAMAESVAGRARSRAGVSIPDSSNGGRETVNLGEDAEYPMISGLPRGGIPDSHNPGGV